MKKTDTCRLLELGISTLSPQPAKNARASNAISASSCRLLSREETGERLTPSTSLRPHRAASRQSPVGCSRLLSRARRPLVFCATPPIAGLPRETL